ncbi:MAG TPA: glycosyltransferase [Verrucomicrobiae bacterium]|nr:glycosyltransferase [Verrucomicrobiae bacterium]
MDGISETKEQGLVVLSPANRRPIRRVLFVNLTSGVALWEKIKQGIIPSQHLWGCLELVRMGYEVAIGESLPNFYLHRNAFPHDLRLLKMARSWLGPDDVLYCGHNVLYWLPFLKRMGLVRCRIVSLLYAREPLDFSGVHDGIVALNSAAADHSRKLAPKAKVADLGWGVDLSFFPQLPYDPQWFLSCGITERDQQTLCSAAARTSVSIRIICPGIPAGLNWPANVKIIDGGKGWNTDDKRVTFQELLYQNYAHCTASLIILNYDPVEYTAVGTTNLIEAMAVGRPVIVTKTGALPSGIDVEKEGCGLFVPPQNPEALAAALETLANDPKRAEAMGAAGRRLAEQRYNMDRYGKDLHALFESL